MVARFVDNHLLRRRTTAVPVTYARAEWASTKGFGTFRKQSGKLHLDLTVEGVDSVLTFASGGDPEMLPAYLKAVVAAISGPGGDGMVISVPCLPLDDEGFTLADAVHDGLHYPMERIALQDYARSLGRAALSEVPAVAHRTLASLKRATRFSLDAAASHLVRDTAQRPIPELLRMMDVARLPFPEVWVEWPAHFTPWQATWDTPDRIGFLCSSPFPDTRPGFITAIAFSGAVGDAVIAYCPIDCHLSGDRRHDGIGITPAQAEIVSQAIPPIEGWTVPEPWFVSGLMALNPGYLTMQTGATLPPLEKLSVGDSYVHIAKHLEGPAGEPMRELIARCRLVPTPLWLGIMRALHARDPELMGRAVRNAMMEAVGDARLLTAFFATLYASPLFVGEVERRTGPAKMLKGKVAPYLEHRRVSLKVPREQHERELDVFTRGGGVPRRAHMVRAHRCTSHRFGDPRCSHPDILRPTPNQELCSSCGARWWWRKAHQRGDASIGFITKDYSVEGRPT